MHYVAHRVSVASACPALRRRAKSSITAIGLATDDLLERLSAAQTSSTRSFDGLSFSAVLRDSKFACVR